MKSCKLIFQMLRSIFWLSSIYVEFKILDYRSYWVSPSALNTPFMTFNTYPQAFHSQINFFKTRYFFVFRPRVVEKPVKWIWCGAGNRSGLGASETPCEWRDRPRDLPVRILSDRWKIALWPVGPCDFPEDSWPTAPSAVATAPEYRPNRVYRPKYILTRGLTN